MASSSPPDGYDGQTRHRIVVLGDSVVLKGGSENGFVARLQAEYAMKADVVNRGHPFGFSSTWGLCYLDGILSQLLPSPRKTMWIIWFGPSDMVVRPDRTEPNVSYTEYERNLERIMERIRGADPEGAIVLVAPLPVDRDRWRARPPYPHVNDGVGTSKSSQRGEDAGSGFDFPAYERLVGYTKRTTTLGFRRNVVVLDPLMAAPDWTNLLGRDGVHLSPDGHQYVFEGLRALIAQNYPQWRAPRIVGDIPAFDPFRDPPQSLKAREDEERTRSPEALAEA